MIEKNIHKIRDRIKSLTNHEIDIVAATKERTIDEMKRARSCGITVFGENYVQDAEEKIRFFENVKFHMIGHLQSNKVKKALEIFDMIQTLDSLELAQQISEFGGADVLVQVNISKEDSKTGILYEDMKEFMKKLRDFQNLHVKGLMCIASKEKAEQEFSKMNKLFLQLKREYNLETLSMGMSDDYEIALKNGSNMIRIGRALFG
jgi:pyridoxal phosphate enzyme (YggS family)